VNLLLLNDDDHVEGQAYSVSGRRLQHLLQVHGAGAGDTLRAGVLGGMMGEAQIREIDERRALLSVSLDTPPPQKLPLCLVLALPRPKMLRRILRTAAELGVPELHLINSYRVEKSYWQTPGMIAGCRGLLAHPGDYPACPREAGGPTLLVIGPEGGFIPYEVEKLADAGCEIVSLGPRILRVENAVTASLGRLF
jgi:16S rRNA U1498 N3-methylase RsmE